MGLFETVAYLAGGLLALLFPIVLIGKIFTALSTKSPMAKSSDGLQWYIVAGHGALAFAWYLYFHAGV